MLGFQPFENENHNYDLSFNQSIAFSMKSVCVKMLVYHKLTDFFLFFFLIISVLD